MRRSDWLIRVGATLLATAGSGALLAAPAEAAPATGVAGAYASNGIFWYRATVDKAHNVVITRSGTTITFDDVTPIKAGQNCKAVKGDKTKVTCTVPSVRAVHVTLGNKNDTLVNKTPAPSTVYGSAGNDKLTGGTGQDVFFADAGNDTVLGGNGSDALYGGAGTDIVRGGSAGDQVSGGTGADKVYGGAGDDTLFGGTGNDVLYGENGNDRLMGETGTDQEYGGAGDDHFDERLTANGADVLDGGAGRDLVDYAGRQNPVRADLTSTTGVSGERGERDTVRNAENALGGWRNDVLVGNSASNTLRGNYGADLIFGRGGNDTLEGGNGSDNLYGEGGDDTLSGLDPAEGGVYDSTGTTDLLDGGSNGTLGDRGYAGAGDTKIGIER